MKKLGVLLATAMMMSSINNVELSVDKKSLPKVKRKKFKGYQKRKRK